MKGRDALREMLSDKPAEATPLPAKRSSGAVRAMNLDLNHLKQEAEAAKSLREQYADSEAVVALRPDEIEASPVSDRIPTDDDSAFEELKAAIADKGQQVPILVRPHPEQQGRYQIAYGRRRLRAALELGKTVKAIVREMSDRDLIIAQAQENGPRADLTFIERALFASNLNAHGFDRDTITIALGVDKPELSRLLTVATGVTPNLILAIGSAPKIGRPRWLSLADKLSNAQAAARATKASQSDEFKRADTNARFNIILSALSERAGPHARKAKLGTTSGLTLGWIERTKSGIRLSIDQSSFVAFLEERLPGLVGEFQAMSELSTKKGGE